jgi:hypothetical protein
MNPTITPSAAKTLPPVLATFAIWGFCLALMAA